MRNIWFTSDTHFGHKNIIRYCNRPFQYIKENNETLISNWNALIKENDNVYHLGDFGFGSVKYLSAIADRLNGKIHLIKGNHDKTTIKLKYRFKWIKDYHELKIFDTEMDTCQNIVLCHYAFQVWNKSHHGAWHLHGHSHGTLPSPDSMARYDVGVDNNNYSPLSYNQIKEIMTRKVFKPVDSHGM